MKVNVISTGRALPKLIVKNEDLAKFLDTNDEWIVTRTGVSTRHIITEETTSDLAINAAKKALEKSGLSPNDIELVVCGTVTPNTIVPTVASNVRQGLGIENCPSFDVNSACSGFIFAVATAESMMKNLGYKKAIVVGVDANSQIIDWEDRGTAVVFGDGAGAIVLSKDGNSKGIISTYLSTIDDSENSLVLKNKISKTPFNNPENGVTKVLMNGQNVMRFAVDALIVAVNKVLEKSGIPLEKIKYIVPHQANLRIISSAAKRMKLSEDRFYKNGNRYANTSAGSIPIALDEMVEKNLLEKGDYIVLVAFGGGLSSGAILIEWE